MRPILDRTRAILLCLVTFSSVLVAQDEPLPDRSAPSSEAHKYEPPSASRSVEVGDYYLRRKNYRGALSRYQEAAATDPFYAPAFLGLGRCYEKMGLRQKALDAYKKYLDELPSQKQALNAKDVQRAVERLERQVAPRTRTSGPAPTQH